MLRKQVLIYTESTPNPNSIKFVLNSELVPEGSSFDYAVPADALVEGKKSPIAVELFGFDWVKRVFISYNFITITKNDETDWGDVLLEVKSFLKKYLEDSKPVLAKASMQSHFDNANGEQDTETTLKIKQILEEYVRPAVESDGGAISFYSFSEETGTVTVLLQGSCSGCPSSKMTLKAGIENLLTRMLPEVKEVVAEGV
jgi:NFU1 iron-sulfur cluster scaffold homolog, mitochondrial